MVQKICQKDGWKWKENDEERVKIYYLPRESLNLLFGKKDEKGDRRSKRGTTPFRALGQLN